ncbi:hypothetical protein ABIA33_003228 [Streptacidiphilus sp. MAP12-16]|uniref:hypothetical protein n=1 Tax=Streptacidiphilus sp. MAP12-16 TaxID=3156300 RepID=UPI003515D3C9
MAPSMPRRPSSARLRPQPRRAAALAAGLAATAALVAGCGGPTPVAVTAASAPAPACHSLPAPVLPHSAGSLTQITLGTYCLTVGQRVDVFLTAPSSASGDKWGAVASSDQGVLVPTSSGVLTAPLGVTPGLFVGATRGTAVLRSSTSTGMSWQVTVVVR